VTRRADACRFSGLSEAGGCAGFLPEVFQPLDFWGRPLGTPRLVCARLEAAGPLDAGPFYARCELERDQPAG
jgi:hypothetical protein